MSKLSEKSQFSVLEHDLEDIKKIYLVGLLDQRLVCIEAARMGRFDLLKWVIDDCGLFIIEK